MCIFGEAEKQAMMGFLAKEARAMHGSTISASKF